MVTPTMRRLPLIVAASLLLAAGLSFHAAGTAAAYSSGVCSPSSDPNCDTHCTYTPRPCQSYCDADTDPYCTPVCSTSDPQCQPGECDPTSHTWDPSCAPQPYAIILPGPVEDALEHVNQIAHVRY